MTALPRIEIDPLAPPPPRIIEDNSHRRSTGTPRPKGVHTKHLTELERFRVRTLYYDAYMSKARIREITGYSVNQIRTAVRAGSASVGKRPGRPKGEKREGRANAELPTRSSSDANTELIQQARRYFAEQAKTPGNDGDSNEKDRGSEDGEEEDENEESTALSAQTRTTTAAPAQTGGPPRAVPVRTGLPTLATATATTTSTPPLLTGRARPSRGKTFADLPPSLRLYIWRCMLSTAPTQTAPSRAWALAVLPQSPWLELGLVAPPHIGRLENPPWSHYVEFRHVPATVLARVNREARGVVLERCSPVLVREAAGREGVPRFVWVDRCSDVLHFYGEEFREELFARAGRCACPEFYR